MAAINKDVVLVVSLVLSVVSLVLLFGVTWYFQSSLDLLQQEVEYDRELLFEQINMSIAPDNVTIYVRREDQRRLFPFRKFCDCITGKKVKFPGLINYGKCQGNLE